jgi:acyl-CoA reductase-like NAD-dependent aldehyde dehydrogenase
VLQAAGWRHGRHHALELPGAMLTRKAGPALAAGCSMVVKPATFPWRASSAECKIASRVSRQLNLPH